MYIYVYIYLSYLISRSNITILFLMTVTTSAEDYAIHYTLLAITIARTDQSTDGF